MNVPADPKPAGAGWAPLSAEDLRERLPQYEVLEMLGRGGMGAVYRARQRSLNREVAIKILPREVAGGALDFVERFKLEARTMARLNHPAIVAVHESGEAGDGQLFFVMEYVEGQDLARRIAESGRLAPDEARRIALAVCEALACAHAAGVVHRDVKPSNILLSRDGQVKVADFGLAKIDDPALSGGITRTKLIMGTPDYAAPELFKAGIVADHRADLYGVGVMLYQMLTGESPRGFFKLPSELGVDARFDAIIVKAMEANREDRYQSAGEFRAALEAAGMKAETGAAGAPPAKAGDSGSVTPGRVPFHKTKWLAAAAAVAVLGIASASLTSGMRARRVSPGTVAAVKVTPPPNQPAVPQVGRTIDLLALVDLSRDALAGKWSVTERGVSVENPGGPAVLELPYQPPEEYDFEIEFTADDIGLNVNQYVSAAGNSFAWKMNAHNCTPPLYGFELFDGKFTKDQVETAATSDVTIEQGERHRSTVEVRRGSLRGLLDGREIVKWSGDVRRLTIEEHSKLRNPRRIGVGSWKRAVTFHEITVREIAAGPGGGVPRGTIEIPVPDIAAWQDATAEVREIAKTMKRLKVDARTMRRAGMGPDVILPLRPTENRGCALRVRYAGEVQVNFNRSDRGYLYLLVQTNQTMFQGQVRDASLPLVFLRATPNPPDYNFAQPHELIFTFENMRLRAWIDGRFIGQGTAHTLTEGSTDILFKAMTVLHGLDFADLR